MRPIDADPIIKNLSAMKTQLGYDAIDIDGMIKALREAEEVVVAQLPNDPLTLDELREMADEIADDFINYVTGGVQNAAPYCANMRPECCERPSWCTGYSKSCKGFYPKNYRRKPKDGES